MTNGTYRSKWTCPTKSDIGVQMFVNVGVRYRNDNPDIKPGTDIPTKAALKRAIADTPGNIELYETTMGREDIWYTSDQLLIGVKYSVVGPNPYTSRKWYATVEKTAKGIKVS